MGIGKVGKKGKTLSIKTARMRKADLIREIQRAEGNFNYFSTATDSRDQWDCYFREDCLLSPKSKKDK